MRAHQFAKVGQVGPAALAVEHQGSQFLLQLLDGSGERRLSDVAGFSGAGEVQAVADRKKVTYLMHFHGSGISLIDSVQPQIRNSRLLRVHPLVFGATKLLIHGSRAPPIIADDHWASLQYPNGISKPRTFPRSWRSGHLCRQNGLLAKGAGPTHGTGE